MEKFIVRTKAYREHYHRFMKYLNTVGYSPASCETFETGIRDFLSWLEKQKVMAIDCVVENHIESFYSYQQERPNLISGGTLSECRIDLHMYTLKLFFQHLQDTEQIEMSPMSDLTYVRSYKRTRENLMSLEDIEKLYGACTSAKQKAVLAIIYGCGLRRQEAVKLNYRDVHFKNAVLYVREGKGGRKRTIPLSAKVVDDLKEYFYYQRPTELAKHPDSAEAFMLNTRGRRMQGESYTEAIRKLTDQTGLNEKITLHHFRHAIATHLLENGMKTEHVKDFLGHASMETTQTYTHITTTQMKKTTAYGLAALPH